MANQNTTPRGPPLRFLLDVIIFEVKSAKRTHAFLCDVFGKAYQPASGPNTMEPPPQGSSLSPDDMHALFNMGNTRIQFSTTLSSQNPNEERNVRIAILVKDIEKVKRVLDQHKVKSKLGQYPELPGCPRWIEFRDQDGYTWHVIELVRA